MPSTLAMMLASCLTGVTALTRNNQIILQFLSIRPDDPLYVERFLGISAFDTEPAVPTRTTEAYHIQELRKIKTNLAKGILPQPSYLVNHPTRGYHLPHPMSPDNVPIEFMTLDDLSSVPKRIKTLGEIILETQLGLTPKQEKVSGQSLFNFFVSPTE